MTDKSQIVLAVVLVLVSLLTIAGILVGSYVSAVNYGVSAEAGIKYAWEDNQQVYGNYTNKVQEIAAVPELYKNDLKEVVTAALTSRYGKDGSKAAFQWIQEHQTNVDPGLYKKIQEVIEAGRNEFQTKQTRLLDLKRNYETNLGYVYRGFWLKLAGFPRTDLSKYNAITSAESKESFQTGLSKPVKLR